MFDDSTRRNQRRDNILGAFGERCQTDLQRGPRIEQIVDNQMMRTLEIGVTRQQRGRVFAVEAVQFVQ